MTGKYKVGDMVLLNNDTRKLKDRRNEARITKVCKYFYLAEKMSNGRTNSYYEETLFPISYQDKLTKN